MKYVSQPISGGVRYIFPLARHSIRYSRNISTAHAPLFPPSLRVERNIISVSTRFFVSRGRCSKNLFDIFLEKIVCLSIFIFYSSCSQLNLTSEIIRSSINIISVSTRFFVSRGRCSKNLDIFLEKRKSNRLFIHFYILRNLRWEIIRSFINID